MILGLALARWPPGRPSALSATCTAHSRPLRPLTFALLRLIKALSRFIVVVCERPRPLVVVARLAS